MKICPGQAAVPFGTGGTNHGGGAERILLTQGGISQGRRYRNRWELRWLQNGGTSDRFGREVFVLRFLDERFSRTRFKGTVVMEALGSGARARGRSVGFSNWNLKEERKT